MKNNWSRIKPGHGPRPAVGASRPLSPSRAELLETLRAQHAPVTIAALTQLTGLHANTLREHLDALIHAGMASRQRATVTGRGRPAWLYLAHGEDVAAAPEYAGLAAALAATIARTSDSPGADAEAAGRSWGDTLASEQGLEVADGPRGAREGVVRLLDRMGFAPNPDDESVEVRLERCPLLEAAHQHPEIVCRVHLGLTKAALERQGVDGEETELIPFAAPGACVLRLPR